MATTADAQRICVPTWNSGSELDVAVSRVGCPHGRVWGSGLSYALGHYADSVVNGSTRKPLICAWADSRVKRLRPDRSAGRRLRCAARRGFEGGIKGLQYLTRRSVVAAFDVGGH